MPTRDEIDRIYVQCERARQRARQVSAEAREAVLRAFVARDELLSRLSPHPSRPDPRRAAGSPDALPSGR